jgi:protein-S-isoprenylcysteine O-methyltransferase Ste14
MNKLGIILYRWRGLIGFIAFCFVWLLSRPSWTTIWFSLPITIIGLFLRFWASGYIGIEARNKKLSAKFLITHGPYCFIRNPLYLGNFFITLGVLVGFSSPVYLIIIILLLFWVEYLIIIRAEQDFLSKQFGEEYLSYCKTTGAILPKNLFGYTVLTKSNNQKFILRNAIREFQTVLILILIYVAIYFRICWLKSHF